MKLLGVDTCTSVTPYIGLEQELFFISRESYLSRLDLQLTGRTLLGRLGPRGQDMCDHCKCIMYMYMHVLVSI